MADVTSEKDLKDLHHDEIVAIALERLKQDLKLPERRNVLEQMRMRLRKRNQAENAERKAKSK